MKFQLLTLEKMAADPSIHTDVVDADLKLAAFEQTVVCNLSVGGLE